MYSKELLDLAIRGVISPKSLWKDKLQDSRSWIEILKFPIILFVSIIAVFSAVMVMVFGYQIPFVGGVVKPSIGEIIIQAIGTVVLYIIPIGIMSLFAGYLSGTLDGINDKGRGLWMLFLVSIPSLFSQVLSTLPAVGMLLGIVLGIYSMVLFYKAIPIFMEVPLAKRLRYFIFLILSSIVVSVVLHFTLGKVFQPTVPQMGSIEIPNILLTK